MSKKFPFPSSVKLFQQKIEVEEEIVMPDPNNPELTNPVPKYIDIDLLLTIFSRGMINSNGDTTSNDYDDVILLDFLSAYSEACKFLDNLGSLFYFAIVDLRDKIALLENHVRTKPNEYSTVLKMAHYEKTHKCLIQINPVNGRPVGGCRNLLRLHRPLIFIIRLVNGLLYADESEKSAQICYEAYEATLAKNHSWLVRRAISLAMYAMPKREVLLSYVCRTDEDKAKMSVVIKQVERAYNIIQRIFEKYDLLELP